MSSIIDISWIETKAQGNYLSQNRKFLSHVDSMVA